MTDKIENIVGIGIIEITEKIDLNKLANNYVNTEYNPERFPGLVMYIEKPHATILIFSTGKMVLTGLKKKSDVQLAFDIVLERFRKIGIKYINPKVKIQNIVATDNSGWVKTGKIE
ncbi:MAG: hypothetical protein ACFE9S_09745 [Candidatus Hermodarchaeota archaeon]